jgi:hypothetical protein
MVIDMKSFKESLNEKDKYFGINPSKAARIARWNSLKEGIRNEWQKVNISRALTTVAIIGVIGMGGTTTYQKVAARSIDKGTELNYSTTRRLVFEAMDRKADKFARRCIERYDLKGELARGIRNYIKYEADQKNLKSDLSSLNARIKSIILKSREYEKLEAGKKEGTAAATVGHTLSLPAKQEIATLEKRIKDHRKALGQLKAGFNPKGYKPETVARMDRLKGQITECTESIYQLDPSRRPAATATSPQPQAKIAEATKILMGTVTWNAVYEFPISRNYDISRLRKNASLGHTNVQDFEKVTVMDMCDFPFSVIKIEKGLSGWFVVVPHIAFRNGDKIELSVKELPDKKISYQQIINQALGPGYIAMQTADVRADYIAVEGKRTE